MITVYAFGSVPAPVHGITRDLRVLWALEECGLPHRVHVLDEQRGERGSAEYLSVHPFGLVPAIVDDGFRLTESAAILFYLADKSGQLVPGDAKARALATQWAFCALNTIEPDAVGIAAIDKFFAAEAWARERRPMLQATLEKRLATLDGQLGSRAYLLGESFGVADILMTSVLRFIQETGLVEAVPNVAAYKARCEARPAWQRCYAAYEERLAA